MPSFPHLTVKNSEAEIRLFLRRIALITLLLLLAMLTLFARLVYLQIGQHRLYTTLSTKNQFSLNGIDPSRGLIFDRHGVLLAENVPVFSLQVIANRVPHLDSMLDELSKIIPITPEEREQFKRQLDQRRRFEATPLKTRLTEEERARFAIDQYRFPGVIIKTQLLRRYPLGEEMVPALGYVARINTKELANVDPSNYVATNFIGKLGIEKYFESELHGKAGYQQVETDASGRTVRVVSETAPEAGKNLYLSLDAHLQHVAHEAFGNQTGAAIAIEPSTGQILAFVSLPSYDPNPFVLGISRKAFQALQEDPNRPLYNRTIRGQYPPGSTIKPFIALEGLETRTISPADKIFDTGTFQLPNSEHVYRDWKRGGHGWVNIVEAIRISCDVFFYKLGVRLGIEKINAILTQFKFGEKTGIESDEELSGLLASPENKAKRRHQAWYPGDTVISGIGQGDMLFTPLQLAQATAVLSMRGKGMHPTLISSTQGPDGKIIPSVPQPLPPIILRDETWNTVFEGMEAVIKSGTGLAHFGTGMSYTAAGKTGTAQVFSLKKNQRYNRNMLPQSLHDHSLFIVFAPVENPKIAIAVMAEHTDIAGHVARAMMDAYLEPAPAASTETPKAEKPSAPSDTEAEPAETEPE